MRNSSKFTILLIYFNKILCQFIQCQFKNIKITNDELKNCNTLSLEQVELNCTKEKFMELKHMKSFRLNTVKFIDCPDVLFEADYGQIENVSFDFTLPVRKSYEVGRTWVGYFQADLLEINGYVKSQLNSQVGIFISKQTRFSQWKRTTIEFGSIVFHQEGFLNLTNVEIIAYTSVECQDSSKYQRPISLINVNGKISQNKFVFEPYININEVMLQINSNSLLEMYYKLTSPEQIYQNYSMMIVIENDSILLDDAKIQGNMIGIFGKNLEISEDSTIDASIGCQYNQGPGRGVSFIYTVNNCAGSGGSSAGKGGVGINTDRFNDKEESDSDCKVLQQALQHLRKINPYSGLGGVYMGSGGGNQGQETVQLPYNKSIGSGGGGIYIGLIENLQIFGAIHADGQCGYQQNYINGKLIQNFGGAGAGGYIILRAKQLIGIGTITARGGPSDYMSYSGEGGGGLIVLDIYQNNYVSFKGSLSVSKGSRNSSPEYLGSDGSIIGSTCQSGYEFDYQHLICKRCLAGQYSFLPIEVCTECPGYTQQEIQQLKQSPSNQQCQLDNCEEFHCDPLQFLTNFVSSLWGILSYLSLFSLIVSGYIIRRIYRLKVNAHINEDLPFDFESATKHMAVNQMITDKLRESQQFKLVDLLYHAHRVTINGDNTWQRPWQLSYLPNDEISYMIDQVVWIKFASRFNKLTQWSNFERFLLVITGITYYPLYWLLIRNIKKKKWKSITQFVNQTDLQFLRCFQPQDDQSFIKFKISKSSDYTLMFLDIFNYKITHMKYFSLYYPVMLNLSGQGDYIRPFYLCESDPFVSLLYFVINRKKTKSKSLPSEDERHKILDQLVSHKKSMDNSFKLNRFLEKFNLFARTIDYGGGSIYFAKRINELLKLTKQWNSKFFSEFNVMFDLIITQTSCDSQGVQSITILENEDSPEIIKFLTEVHKKHLNLIYDTKIGLFVYDTSIDADSVIEHAQKQRVTISDVQKMSMIKEDEEEMNIDDLKEIYLQRTNNYQNNHINYLNNGDILMMAKGQKKKSFLWLSINFLSQILNKIRYLFFTHHIAIKNKYTLILFQLIMSFLDGIFLPVYVISFVQDQDDQFLDDQLLFWPFPFVILFAPLIGCLWMSTQSYGIAKLYLIFTGMSFINLFLNITMSIQFQSSTNAARTAIFIQITDLIIKLGLIVSCKRILSVNVKLNKLNQAKQFIN